MINNLVLEHMTKIQKKTILRVAGCYRTTSYVAAVVVSGIPPLSLLVEERTSIHDGNTREESRITLLERWQADRTSASKGRWTQRLILDLRICIAKNREQVSNQLTQFFTSYGCFRNYMKHYGCSVVSSCAICGSASDTAEHVVLEYDAWKHWWRNPRSYLKVEVINTENVISLMQKSKKYRHRIQKLVERIIQMREPEERTIQLLELQDNGAFQHVQLGQWML